MDTISRREFKAQAEKYFWKNSALIYKWKKRTDKQPSLT